VNLDNPESKGSSVANDTSVRRTFLKRASAGAVIASIPGRSAWATVNGSVVASGHGSGTSSGACTQLLSHGYWKMHLGDWGSVPTSQTFVQAFGGPAIGNTSGQNIPASGYYNSSLTLSYIIAREGNGPSGFGGPENVNIQMIAMYLNAANHGQLLSNQLLYYPVLANYAGKLNPSDGPGSYGAYLYSQALSNPGALGLLLSSTISTNHAPSDGSLNTSC
jgi:hypothetical protein